MLNVLLQYHLRNLANHGLIQSYLTILLTHLFREWAFPIAILSQRITRRSIRLKGILIILHSKPFDFFDFFFLSGSYFSLLFLIFFFFLSENKEKTSGRLTARILRQQLHLNKDQTQNYNGMSSLGLGQEMTHLRLRFTLYKILA